MINSWTSNYSWNQYSIFADPNLMSTFQNGAFQTETGRTFIEHRRPSISVRSLLPSTNCVTKETISQSANSEAFRAKMRNTPTCIPILTILYLVANCSYFHVKSEEMHTTLMRGLSIRLFWNGIGEAHADPQAEWPEWFKKYHKCLLYPSRTALPCQISTGKWNMSTHV